MSPRDWMARIEDILEASQNPITQNLPPLIPLLRTVLDERGLP